MNAHSVNMSSTCVKRRAEWSHANKPKLSDILEDDFLGDVYLRFLESSLSAEVYMFYATAEKYKSVADDKKRKRVFDKIVETFLVDGR
jgi:Regulator of G protein signaling domain